MKKLFPRRKPVFTVSQLNRLSNISDNAGQVVLGIAVLSPMLSSVNKINPLVVSSGIIGTISCWALSLLFARKGENR